MGGVHERACASVIGSLIRTARDYAHVPSFLALHSDQWNEDTRTLTIHAKCTPVKDDLVADFCHLWCDNDTPPATYKGADVPCLFVVSCVCVCVCMHVHV